MNIVYCYLVLDIVHRGHLLFMQNSKAIAGPNGRLIVGIVSDEAGFAEKGSRPILSFSERLELAKSIKYVDVGVGQKDYSPFNNVKTIKPSILIESDSHSDAQIESSKTVMDEIGGRVIIMPYFKGQSSTNIKQKITGANL